MIWHRAATTTIALGSVLWASAMVCSDATTPATETVDVVIIGAGAAGAAAAREFRDWNRDRRGHHPKISYALLEAQDRLGGRILDVELGGIEGQEPTRTSGGFDVSTGARKRCHCDQEAGCPKFRVEVGAGWFTGEEGPDGPLTPRSCQNQSAATSGRASRTKEEEDEDPPVSREAIRAEKALAVEELKELVEAAHAQAQRDGRKVLRMPDEEEDFRAIRNRRVLEPAKEEEEEAINYKPCKRCPKNYNRLYAISQGKGETPATSMNKPLDVNCNNLDGQDDYYDFLYTGDFYGKNIAGDDDEMYPIDYRAKTFPSFDQTGDRTFVKAARFLTKFWYMLDKCVDYQAYQLWYQYQYENCPSHQSPFFYGDFLGTGNAAYVYSNDTMRNTVTWEAFDVGFPAMPDAEPFWNQTLARDRRRDFCAHYHELMEEIWQYNTTLANYIDAARLSNFYRNFQYFSEFLGGQDMSFGNFGDDGSNPWGYNISYSIDQRGLKSVVDQVMPNTPGAMGQILYQHQVTRVDYSGDSSCCQNTDDDDDPHPVEVTVRDLASNTTKIYCAKRVISTVSIGVIGETIEDNIFSPPIDTTESPFSGMGELVKLYVRFPETFWGDEEYITFLMTEDFRKHDGIVKGEYFYNLDRWFANLCDNKKTDVFCDTKSLFLFLATPDLEEMGFHDSNVSDDAFADKVKALLEPLRVKYGDAYREPNCWEFHDWSDPLHRGAYGIWKKGKTYCDHIRFFTPRTLDNQSCGDKVLYLSGEASCMAKWGFIEGAYEAGSRDAKIVINDLMDIHEEVFSACGNNPAFDKCSKPKCREWSNRGRPVRSVPTTSKTTKCSKKAASSKRE